MIAIRRIYAVEISGVCNLESKCTWCPMHKRPRARQRGLMSESTVDRALLWVQALGKVDALALHVFGEPLLHPRFDEYAKRFAEVTAITMSTNGTYLDEKWADRLARIPWAWISVSPWDASAAARAIELLSARDIKVGLPPGATHDWAGQARIDGESVVGSGCEFLQHAKAVIRWDGGVASCCVSDRAEDSLGDIFGDALPSMHGYSLCETCHLMGK